MPWWFWAALGAGWGVWMWRLTFSMLIEDIGAGDCGGLVMVALISTAGFYLIGPFVLLGRAIRWITGGDWDAVARVLGGESRTAKRRRKDRELREREERIRELERELGIDP